MGQTGGETLRVNGIGGGEHGRPGRHLLVGQAKVHVMRGEQAQAAVMMCDVVPREENVAMGRTSWIEPNRAGKSGRYLNVSNWISEKGLSLETCGRLWVLVIPRSASRNATDLEVMAEPRSAWIVSGSRPMRCRVQVSWMNRSASVAFSRWATIQPRRTG